MALFHVTPHPIETQLLAGANQTRADFVFDVMPNAEALRATGAPTRSGRWCSIPAARWRGNKMQALKEAVKQILANLPNEETFEIQVIFFHSYARELIEPTHATDIHATCAAPRTARGRADRPRGPPRWGAAWNWRFQPSGSAPRRSAASSC